jgi:hypothetical protein
LNPGGQGGFMKPGRAVHAVAIEQRQRWIPKRRGAIDKRFGERSGLKKTESRRGVELDEHNGDGGIE